MYVRMGSWHTLAMTFRSGAVKTRCGRTARVAGTIVTAPGIPSRVSPTSDALPLGERSCESCLRLTAHDQEPPDVETDEAHP